MTVLIYTQDNKQKYKVFCRLCPLLHHDCVALCLKLYSITLYPVFKFWHGNLNMNWWLVHTLSKQAVEHEGNYYCKSNLIGILTTFMFYLFCFMWASVLPMTM